MHRVQQADTAEFVIFDVTVPRGRTVSIDPPGEEDVLDVAQHDRRPADTNSSRVLE